MKIQPTTDQQNQITELLARLSIDDLKCYYADLTTPTDVAEWLLAELQDRLSEADFIAFCEDV